MPLKFSRLLEDEPSRENKISRAAFFAALALFLHLAFFSLWGLFGSGPPDLENILKTPPLELNLNLRPMEKNPESGDGPEKAADGNEGADAYAPMENEGAAAGLASLALERESPLVKTYHSLLRRRIISRWLVPPAGGGNFKPGRLAVKVSILKDGTLAGIYIIESTGSAALDHAALEALRASAPFPPFPPELASLTQLELRLNFDYKARYKALP